MTAPTLRDGWCTLWPCLEHHHPPRSPHSTYRWPQVFLLWPVCCHLWGYLSGSQTQQVNFTSWIILHNPPFVLFFGLSPPPSCMQGLNKWLVLLVRVTGQLHFSLLKPSLWSAFVKLWSTGNPSSLFENSYVILRVLICICKEEMRKTVKMQ